MSGFKCKNEGCGRVFLLPARITVEKKPVDFSVSRVVVEKPCCPFCEGLEFEEVSH